MFRVGMACSIQKVAMGNVFIDMNQVVILAYGPNPVLKGPHTVHL